MLVAMGGENPSVAAGLPGGPFSFGRKKARKSCSFLSNSADNGSPQKVSPHLVPFHRTASFEHNVDSLCGQFPQVHQGVITSLLESAANDVSKASCLIQQVSESGMNAPRHAKRSRDWIDVSMDDDHSDNSNIGDGSSRTTEPFSRTNNSFHLAIKNDSFLPESSLPSNSPHDSPMASQEVPNSGSVASPVPSAQPVSENPSCPSSPGTVQGLKHTIQVLSRAVLKQSERLSSIQAEQHRLVDENRQLKSSLITSNDELKQCREANQILQFYLSSNRASTDNFFVGGDGGNGPGGFFSNRSSDVF